MTKVNVDRVRAQIRAEQNDGDGVTALDAMSVVRSAVGQDITSADIRAAIAQSELSAAERKVLLGALKAVTTLAAVKDRIVTVSHEKYETGRDAKLLCKCRASGVVAGGQLNLGLRDVEGALQKGDRESIFRRALAQAYGLDADSTILEGLTKETLETLLAQPGVKEAYNLFTHAPVASVLIPLPTL